MKISCDVIKDILPLYAEDLASTATRELVDDHLCSCDSCTKLLPQLLKKPEVMPDTNTDALNQVKKTIQKRRMLAVWMCFFLTATLALGTFAFLTRPIYLSTKEAETKLIEEGDKIYFEFGDKVDCFSISYEYVENKLDVVITAYRRLWNVHYGNMNDYRYDRDVSEFRWGVTNGGDLRRISYGNSETGEEDTLLWGEPSQDHSISLPRLVLNYYVMIALLLTGLLMVMALLLWKKKHVKVIATLALLFFSYVVASYVVMGKNLLVHVALDLPWYLGMILACTVLIWGALMCGWNIMQMRKKGSGI